MEVQGGREKGKEGKVRGKEGKGGRGYAICGKKKDRQVYNLG